jgi:branched-chain amino acid transport system substrate-binding protein
VHALGSETAEGLRLKESFYWDLNDRSRAFTNRLRPKIGETRPTMFQAGDYASTLHYLKAAVDMGVGGEGGWSSGGRTHESDADRRRLLR